MPFPLSSVRDVLLVPRNLAAAERTLQKSLAAVKASDGGQVRPHFRCRLAGTLADIIARSEQTAGLVAGKSKKDSASRSAEIVDLLRYGYEVQVLCMKDLDMPVF